MSHCSIYNIFSKVVAAFFDFGKSSKISEWNQYVNVPTQCALLRWCLTTGDFYVLHYRPAFLQMG